MPNETLLNQLSLLTESYTQRKKTATAVQAAFKLVTDAHSKTLKALRDYAEQDTTVDVAAPRRPSPRVRMKEEAIDPLLPDLRREIKTLAGADRGAQGERRRAAQRAGRRGAAGQGAARAPDAQGAAGARSVPELQQELDLAQRALGDEFGQKLRAALADLGVAIGGRPPKFELGRFELDANFASRFGVLRYGKDVVAPHVPITVDATVKAYQGAVKAIAGPQPGRRRLAGAVP